MSALSELLVARMRELGVDSVRELARRSQRHPGGSLDASTIAMYVRGEHRVPNERTIACLAWVFEIDRNALVEAARLPPALDPFVLPPEADRLTLRQRKAIIELVRSMVDDRQDAQSTVGTG